MTNQKKITEVEEEQILDKVTELLQNDYFEEAIVEANKLLDHDPVTTHTIVAQTYFKMGKYGNAEKCYDETARLDPSTITWFNVATSSTMNGNFKKGRAAFDKAMELQIKEEGNDLKTQIYVFYYMQCLGDMGQFEAALEQLNKFKNFYSRMKVTDFTHAILATGGDPSIPSFETIIDRSKGILEQLETTRATKWLDDFAAKVDESGKNYIQKFKSTLEFKS